MIMLGIICVVAAIVLIVLGVVNAAVSALLWVGVGLAVVGAVLVVLSRRGPRAGV